MALELNGTTGVSLVQDGVVTTAKIASSTLVGTVSESSGVPTGAIIERGSNANGEYVKYADGTMICTAGVDHDFSTINRSSHSYPASFASPQDVSAAICFESTSSDPRHVAYAQTFVMRNTSSQNWDVNNQATRAETLQVMLTAFGRWF